MIDREKIIKGLEHCTREGSCCGCIYRNQMKDRYDGYKCDCTADALELLKEQEPVEPIITDGDDLYWQPGDEDYACGSCGEELAGSWWVYCPYCGQAVKWE